VQEKSALKKLENVKTDHAKRLVELEKEQMSDVQKAQLIEINHSLVRYWIMFTLLRAVILFIAFFLNSVDLTHTQDMLANGCRPAGSADTMYIESLSADCLLCAFQCHLWLLTRIKIVSLCQRAWKVKLNCCLLVYLFNCKTTHNRGLDM